LQGVIQIEVLRTFCYASAVTAFLDTPHETESEYPTKDSGERSDEKGGLDCPPFFLYISMFFL
jgi:hypothetical protein